MGRVKDSIEEELIREVASEMSMTIREVRDIVTNGQSAFTKHIIESGKNQSVRWFRFGVFKIKIKSLLVSHHLKGLDTTQKREFFKNIKSGKLFGKK